MSKKKLKFMVEVTDGVNKWSENYEHSTEELVEGFSENMINQFNSSLRPGERPRRLLSTRIE